MASPGNQPIHFVEREELRERRPRARRMQVRDFLELLFEGEMAVEAANGGNRARDRTCRTHPSLINSRTKASESGRVGGSDAAFTAGREPGEHREIAGIAFQRLIGKAARDAQMIQITVDGCGHGER